MKTILSFFALLLFVAPAFSMSPDSPTANSIDTSGKSGGNGITKENPIDNIGGAGNGIYDHANINGGNGAGN